MYRRNPSVLLIGRDIPIEELKFVLISPEFTSLLPSSIFLDAVHALDHEVTMECRRNFRLSTSQNEKGGASWEIVVQTFLEEWVRRDPHGASFQRLIRQLIAGGLGECAEAAVEMFTPSEISRYFSNTERIKRRVSPKASYYIRREIQTRNVISRTVLDDVVSEVLTFSGVRQRQLGVLIDSGSVASSTQELLSRTRAKFIVLNEPDHFSLLCENISGPVHNLNVAVEGGAMKMKWEESKGSAALIRNHIVAPEMQERLSEEIFLAKLATSSHHVCIGGSPGIGKSLFLCEIKRGLGESCPEKKVVFLPMTDFLKELDKRESSSRSISAIETTIKHLARDFTLDIRSGGNMRVELLLDGFDEVSTRDIPLAHQVLEIISENFKSVRLCVTTRPHLLPQLETTLNVLGYTLCPFSREDQISSITCYWTRKLTDNQNQDEIIDRLRKFAEVCLNLVHSKVSVEEERIAGIPLICVMLAEILQENANVVMTLREMPEIPLEMGIETITDLYEFYIQTKLERFRAVRGGREEDDETLLEMLVVLAADTIFPGENLVATVGVDVVKVLQSGLVQASSTLETPQFLHRTIAEYILTRFLAKWLKSEKLNEEENSREDEERQMGVILFQKLLQFEEFIYSEASPFTKSLPRRLHDTLKKAPLFQEMSSARFTSTLPNFLNLLLEKAASTSRITQLVASWKNEISQELPRFFHAAARSDCHNLFSFFLELASSSGIGLEEIFDSNYIQLAAYQSSKLFLEKALEVFEIFQELDFDTTLKIFRPAVVRGDYPIVQYILNERSLKQQLRAELSSLPLLGRELLHECVSATHSDPESVIDHKISIAYTLAVINPGFLTQLCSSLNCLPHLSCGIHKRIIFELLERGADCLSSDIFKDTLLHLNWKTHHLKPTDYFELFQKISIECQKILVGCRNKDGFTPLCNAVFHSDHLPETFDAFRDAGADFNAVTNRGIAILPYAVSKGRNAETLRKLVECGADVNWREWWTGINLMHLAAYFGNATAVEILVTEFRFDINERCRFLITPMGCAKMNNDKTKEAQEVLEKYGARKWLRFF